MTSTLLDAGTLLTPAQGRGFGNTNISGPGNVAGGNTGAAVTIGDTGTFGMWWGIMNAATPAITLPSPSVKNVFRLRLDQDVTGSRNPTFATPSGSIVTPSGAFGIIPTAQARNFASLYADGTNWYLFPETTNLAFVTAAQALAISGIPSSGQVLTATGPSAAHFA